MKERTVISEEFRTARIIHKCSYCGKDIEPGTRYHRVASILKDTVYTDKCHKNCYEDFLQEHLEES
jgi:hypothetical protein